MPGASARLAYLITAVAIAVSIFLYVFALQHVGEPHGLGLERVYKAVIAVLVITWLASHPAIPAERRPSLDFGMFLWITFPFLAIWMMIRARGWRGALILLGLLGLVYAPSLGYWVGSWTTIDPG